MLLKLIKQKKRIKTDIGHTHRKLDNRGISLVEIIIVVAIMSVIIGVSGYGLSLISGRPAQACAQKLAGSLQHTRTISMGKYATYARLARDDNGKVWFEVYQKIKEADGDYAMVRQSNLADGSVSVICDDEELGNGKSILIGFDRSTGALTDKVGGDKPTTVVGKIIVSKANTTVNIGITKATGKVFIEYN